MVNFIIQASFKFMAKLSRMYRDFPSTLPHQPCPPPLMNLQIHHYRPECTVSSGFPLGGVHSVGFYRCIVTCIHHNSVIRRSSTALRILSAPPIIHPSLPLTLVNTDRQKLSAQFCLSQKVIQLESRVCGLKHI